ncbi:putative ribosomal protein L11/L12 [Helianthus anomalus]
MAKELQGTVNEILGTCVSVGCTVDEKDPKDLQQEMVVVVRWWLCGGGCAGDKCCSGDGGVRVGGVAVMVMVVLGLRERSKREIRGRKSEKSVFNIIIK